MAAGNRPEGGGVHGREGGEIKIETRSRRHARPSCSLPCRAVPSRRHQSEVECVQSLIMRPSEKKRHWKSRSGGHDCVCTRVSVGVHRAVLCARASTPPSATTLKSPAPPYIVHRRIVHSRTFFVLGEPINLRPFPLTSHYRTRTRILVMLDRKASSSTTTMAGGVSERKSKEAIEWQERGRN